MSKLLFILMLVGTAVQAAPMSTDVYRHTLQQGVERGVFNHVAVGWIDGNTRSTWFFGRTPKPDNNSRFEIGTVSEVFTGLLLAQEAYVGRLRLRSPIRDLLPPGFVFADATLGQLRAQDLAIHHTPFPALPPNLMPTNIDDPFADYSESDLLDFLTRWPGHGVSASADYSPLDVGLLGYLLGRGNGGYARALYDKVLTPLGLKQISLDDIRLLSGAARGQTKAPWHFGALGGSAGLRSNLGDLLDFLQTNLRPEKSPLRAALLLARQPHANAAGKEAGLGWNIVQVGDGDQTWPLVWRASATSGFFCFIGFRTDRQQALVLLGDSSQDLSGLGLAWLEQRDPPPLPPAAPMAPDAARLVQYPGLYQVRDGVEIIVRLSARGLTAQLPGQPPLPLHADADDVFDSGTGLGLSFQRESGKVTSLVYARQGANFLAQRLSTHAPVMARVALAQNAESLAAYVGDYQLDADTLMRISVHSDTLVMQMTGRAAVLLFGFAPDRFSDADGSCELDFMRDVHANVTALNVDFAGGVRKAQRVPWSQPLAQK